MFSRRVRLIGLPSLAVLVLASMAPPGRGVLQKEATIPEATLDLSAQRGRAGWKGPIEEWYWLFGNPRRIAPNFFFGDDPFIDAAVRVNPQTRAYLYGKAPRPLSYQKGSRPGLEEVVREVTKGCTTDAQRAGALLQWVHALRQDPRAEKGRFQPRLVRLPDDPHAAEHVIKNGGGSCEWLTRLFVSLAQAANLPARLVIRRVHTQAEVHIDGRWELCCPLMGDHGEQFLGKPAGQFAGKSAFEVYDRNDPKQEVAVARSYLGEQRQVKWLHLKADPGKGELAKPAPAARPVLAESFTAGALPLKPMPQPGPPEPLHMVPPQWSVKDGRARVDFAPGLFFHLNQTVVGEEIWKDVGIEATIWREPRDRQSAGMAGLVFRAVGQNYNAVLLQDDRAVLVVRIEEGWKTRVLARFPWPLEREGPVQVHVRCQGDSADVWLDGRRLGGVKDGLWPAGRVGLAAVQTASFDDFKVWVNPPAPPLPPAPSVVATTEDLNVSDVLEWDRLLLDVGVPSGQCQPEYSTDAGKTWKPVPADHVLSEADTLPGRIRFRLKCPPGAGSARLGVEYRTSNDLKPGPPARR